MLILSRKSPEVVVVSRSGGSDPVLKVTVLETRGGKVKLAFETGGIGPPTSAAETERQVVNVRAARCVRQAQREARLYAESVLATVREPLLVLDANLRVKTANLDNHHYQSSANQGFFWWEIDVTYYLIRLLGAVGLVWDVRRPSEKALRRRALEPEGRRDHPPDSPEGRLAAAV